ncbi:MAG: SNF2-related protein, partial [Thermomicrobiales bacterium]
MKLIKNTGDNRVVDEVRAALGPQSKLDIATPAFSLFAFGETKELLEKVTRCRLVLPTRPDDEPQLLGGDADRPFRNRLISRALARQLAAWVEKKVELRGAPTPLPQSLLAIGNSVDLPARVLTGHCAFTTDGLGLTPGNQFSLIQCAENTDECAVLSSWFDSLWNALPTTPCAKNAFLTRLRELTDHRAPSLIYYLTLFHVFKDLGDELDEERIVKSATGIRNTTVWKKLFKFQRDGVVGAIDKLERLGGCIIADSVGLGKTFEALAIIKYYELRNDRVLVLAPKRLRDNWTLYKANDRRNFLASDRFNYDVLNHTDLSRDGGSSG